MAETDTGEEVQVDLEKRQIKLRGHDVIVYVSILVGMGTLAWFINIQHIDFKASHDRIEDAQAEAMFFLSLPEKEKEKYQLKMPVSLCRKMERHC